MLTNASYSVKITEAEDMLYRLCGQYICVD